MSKIPLMPRKAGEPFVPRDRIIESLKPESGEIIVMSYVPSGPESEHVVPFKERVFSMPPPPSEQQQKMLELQSHHYFSPFTPDSTINSLNPRLARSAACALMNLGFYMVKGIAVAFDDTRTANNLVASELVHGTNGEQALTDALKDGSYIGPFATRAIGPFLPGDEAVAIVLPGVGLWSRPEPSPEQ